MNDIFVNLLEEKPILISFICIINDFMRNLNCDVWYTFVIILTEIVKLINLKKERYIDFVNY
jgi:hypothetical protein